MCRHQRKIRSHYVQILSHIFLCAVLLVTASGCANNQAEHPARRVVAVEIPEVSVRSVKDDVDAVCGVLPVENGVMIVGKKGSHLSAVIQDQDGQTVSETLLQERTDTAEVLCVCSNHLGGVSVLLRETSDNNRTSSGHPAFIVHFQPDGTAVKTISLSETAFMPVGLCVLPDGTSVLSDTSRLLVCDPQGNMMEYGRPEGTEILSVATAGDQCYVVSYHVGVLGVYPFDIRHGTYGDFVRCRGEVTPIIMFGGSLDGSIYVNTGDAIYEYNPEENVFTQRFLWDAVSVSGETIDYFAVSDHHTFTGVTVNDVTLYQVTTTIDEIERHILRVASKVNYFGAGSRQLERAIQQFNVLQHEHYAQLTYFDDETQLKLAMLTDEAPDIIDVSNFQIPVTPDKFVDYLSLFQDETRVTQDDLMPNVIDALLIDDHLTIIPDFFSIFTVAGRSDNVGSTPGISMKKAKELLEEKGDGYTLFPPWMTREIMMEWIASFGAAKFVDYDHMAAGFDNDDYIDRLCFCALGPAEDIEEEPYSDFRETTLMNPLAIHYMDEFEQIKKVYRDYGAEDYTYIGFPNNEGETEHFFCHAGFGVLFAVPKNTGNMEGAWELIQMMLSEEWQDRPADEIGLPLNRHAFQNVLSNEVAKPDAILTAEDYDRVMTLIHQTTHFMRMDFTIKNIQTEEAGAFFAGQKSAEEVARIIQARISLYLEEKK